MGQELRCKARFDLFVPITVSVLSDKSEIPAVTRNVSSGGVYFYTQGSLHEGDAVEFELTLPAVITHAGDIPVMCRGQVLRIDPHHKEGLSGVAVRIDTLTFMETFPGTVDGVQPPSQA